MNTPSASKISAVSRRLGGIPLAQWLGIGFASFVLILVAGFVIWMTLQLIGVLMERGALLQLVKSAYWMILAAVDGRALAHVFGLILFLLCATIILPADSLQRVFSHALYQDGMWAIARKTVVLLLLAAYVAYLSHLFREAMQWSFFGASEWPKFWRIVLTVLVGDLLYWIRHLSLHKIPCLWRFHAIHHSQKELSPLTSYRAHPGELLVTLSIWFVPMFVLTHSLGVVAEYAMIHFLVLEQLDLIAHSNLRSNFGLLRFVLVTPQSHRVHHACEPEYFDMNFGASLSIWDFLFGTRCRDVNAYPRTGIVDPEFPHEMTRGNPLLTLVKQLHYPFQSRAANGNAHQARQAGADSGTFDTDA